MVKEKMKTIKSFLKRTWLFIFLAALVIIVIFLKFYPKEISEEPIPLEKPLILVSVNPSQGRHETIWGSYPIKFNFNKEVKGNSLLYQIKPQRETFIEFENQDKTLAIYPRIGWNQKIQYEIVITALESKEGEKLSKPINYSFIITPPETYDVW